MLYSPLQSIISNVLPSGTINQLSHSICKCFTLLVQSIITFQGAFVFNLNTSVGTRLDCHLEVSFLIFHLSPCTPSLSEWEIYNLFHFLELNIKGKNIKYSKCINFLTFWTDQMFSFAFMKSAGTPQDSNRQESGLSCIHRLDGGQYTFPKKDFFCRHIQWNPTYLFRLTRMNVRKVKISF